MFLFVALPFEMEIAQEGSSLVGSIRGCFVGHLMVFLLCDYESRSFPVLAE